ncbi:MAG: ABC transporter permease [Eubacteriaceae bacterium]|nr:ABC transporter permease [Eubacteriaceae bacterium]
MRSTKAIFAKQAKDMSKNPMVLVMFVIFPAVALVMTQIIAKPNDDIPNNMFVTMMSAIFAGMGLITATSAIFAEDIERKSLRFLIIAGVKPQQYLAGTGGFLLLAGTATSAVFALIGDFDIKEALKFLAVMITGTAGSIILGAAIGMLSKNQQAATAFGLPVSVIVGFTPMVAAFDEKIAKAAGIFYTQQINVVVNDFSVSLAKPMLVITANIVVFTGLFVFAYLKNGLKG